MRKLLAWLGYSLCAAGMVAAIAGAAQTRRLIFLSTQLRPIEEAQKMRNLILKDFPQEVDYITEQPQQFPVHIQADQQSGAHTIDVVGALHGELQPLVALDALVPLDDLAGKLTGRGIPDPLLALGKFDRRHIGGTGDLGNAVEIGRNLTPAPMMGDGFELGLPDSASSDPAAGRQRGLTKPRALRRRVRLSAQPNVERSRLGVQLLHRLPRVERRRAGDHRHKLPPL